MSVYKDKAKGRFRFSFDKSIGGRQVRVTKLLPKSWTQAQADAFDRQESARLYAEATNIQRSQHTIEDAVAGYLKGRVPDLKHGHEVAAELALIYWVFRGRTLDELADACKAYAAHAKDTLAPATIKKRIRYLVAACRWSWRHLDMGDADSDPGARVVTPTVRNISKVYITRPQMLALARACAHRPTRAAIRIAFYSGMRLGEIERAERIKLASGEMFFVLDDTKNEDPAIVPVHPRIRCCVHFKLGTRYQTGYHMRKARALVGLEKVKFHTLRHSTASEMINAGEDLYTVGTVLRHRSTQSTQRYAHLSTAKLTAAIGRIGRRAA